MFNKKGLSEVVSNVLIILVVIGAVALIAGVVINIVQTGTESTASASACLTTKFEVISCTSDAAAVSEDCCVSADCSTADLNCDGVTPAGNAATCTDVTASAGGGNCVYTPGVAAVVGQVTVTRNAGGTTDPVAYQVYSDNPAASPYSGLAVPQLGTRTVPDDALGIEVVTGDNVNVAAELSTGELCPSIYSYVRCT
jgi:hypothetical protein